MDSLDGEYDCAKDGPVVGGFDACVNGATVEEVTDGVRDGDLVVGRGEIIEEK